MRLLFDHCVDRRLLRDFAAHYTSTAGEMGWARLRNGKLLQVAADASFDVFVTVDRGIKHQQNPKSLPIAVVILRAASNDVEDLAVAVPAALEQIKTITKGELVEIAAPGFET